MSPITDLEPLRVIILDDDANFRRRLTAGLCEYGLDALSFSSIAETLAAIATKVPDVLVLSPLIEEGAGFQLIQRLRSDDGVTSTATIALSHSMDGPPRLIAQTFDAFIVKPCSARQVVDRIDQLFETKTAQAVDAKILAA